MISLIFLAFSLFTCSESVQLFQYPIFTSQVVPTIAGLSSYTINAMNFSGNEKILIFGGLQNNQTQKYLLQLKINNHSSIIQPTIGQSPPSRSHHCAIVHQYKMYIYGGRNDSGIILSDLWVYNSIFMSWQFISQSEEKVNYCNLVIKDNNIIVMGIDNTSKLKIIQYSLLSNQWNILTYYFKNSKLISGNTWYHQTATSTISLQNYQKIQNPFQTIDLFITQFYLQYLKVLPLPKNNTNYLFITEQSIIDINIDTLQISLIRSLEYISSQVSYDVQILISQDWLFFVTYQYQISKIVVEYYLIQDFQVLGRIQFGMPENSKFGAFVYENDIYFIGVNTMKGYRAIYKCKQLYSDSVNVLDCFYNKIFCYLNSTGQNCSEKACPNTLSLYDPSSHSQIISQCNNHGTCVSSTCICEQYWAGQDCSIYKRKQCYGVLLGNWPVDNCQCQSQVVGGNNCDVVYCYNDCSRRGQCLRTGVCVCNSGYYGQDCSITIIQFPGASISLN